MTPFLVAMPFVLLFGAYSWMVAKVNADDQRARVRLEELEKGEKTDAKGDEGREMRL
jgi:hypothetical protein